MQVAIRATRPQLSLRTLLMLGTATLLVIVGLLAMHTFTADPAGHGSPGLTQSTSTAGHDHATTGTGSLEHGSAACDGPCHVSTGHEQGHTDMVTACVLALLAGVLLLLAPLMIRRHGFSLHRVMSLLKWDATGILPRAPSLTFLSISRT